MALRATLTWPRRVWVRLAQTPSAGELLDGAVALTRRHFWPLVLVLGPVQLANNLARLGAYRLLDLFARLIPRSLLTPAILTYLFLAYSVFDIILLRALAAAPLTEAIVAGLDGQPVQARRAWWAARRHWRAVLGGGVLMLGLFAATLLFALVPVAGQLLAPGLFLMLWGVVLPLLVPISILENISPWQALRRLWHLVRRRFWALARLVFGLSVFYLGAVCLPTMTVTIYLAYWWQRLNGLEHALLSFPALLATGLLFSLFYLPIEAVVLLRFYEVTRNQSEGLDLFRAAAPERRLPLRLALIVAPAGVGPRRSLLRMLAQLAGLTLLWAGFIALLVLSYVLFFYFVTWINRLV